MNLKKSLYGVFVLLFCSPFCFGKIYEVKSPSGAVSVKIEDGHSLKYSMFVDGEAVLENCEIGMDTSMGKLGANAVAKSVAKKPVNEIQKGFLFIKSEIPDVCNETAFNFGKYTLLVRVYDDAFAYRFIANFGGEMTVNSEMFELKFQNDAMSWIHGSNGEQACFEEEVKVRPVRDLAGVFAAGLPYIVQTQKAKVAVLESDVFSYPSLRVSYDKDRRHPKGWQSRYPKTFKIGSHGRTVIADEYESFIAKTAGSRSFPWRILQVARDDSEFFESDIVYKLATPSKIKDVSWISYGVCAWDWMSRGKLRGVDFDPGLNQPTVHYFIDFAAKFGITFSLVDDGWVKGDAINDDTLFISGERRIDINQAVKYAHSKNVKFLLWALAKNLSHDPENSFKMIADYGVDGLKIDFIERDDQLANELYENFARIAAKNRLVIFYHGCSRPTGMNRTYPNILSYESVQGNEFPGVPYALQNIKTALTRGLAGPMDYTPGVMVSSQERGKSLRDLLVAHGTRSSQMALFVFFYTPIQMLCDSPTSYEAEAEVTQFLVDIPTVWDETKGLDSKFDEYANIARRKGETWYFAGLTIKGNHHRKQKLSEFLNPAKKYRAEIYRDTTNSHKIGMDFKHEVREVSGNETMEFPIANNGGFVMKFTPVD